MASALFEAALARVPTGLHQALERWLSPAFFGVMAALTLLSIVVVVVGIPWLVARLPDDYFQTDAVAGMVSPGPWPWWRILLHLGKNLLGLVLFVAGIAMLILPGQGVLTLLAAVLLLDFPGKRRLERYLISRPQVLAAVNRIRRRANQPPLIL